MFKKGKKLLSTILSLSVFTSLFMGTTLITKAEPVNIALNKTATSSSNIAGSTASLAFDGNSSTRWESDWSDPQWISVDLGTSYNVTGVKLNWETAAAKDYKIQVSTDNASWVDAYTKTGGTGGTETLTFSTPTTGRYVRMYGTARTTGYGYSLWDFEVYGTAVTQSSNIALNKTATASSFLGGNTAALAFDSDNAGTRWESAFSDPQWISVDLGSTYNVTGAKLIWETAAAKDYKIQVSSDNSNWVDAYTKTGGTGGTEAITFGASVTGRYVRMYGTTRTTQYGYSLWGFEVYGTAVVANKVSTPAITPSNGSYTSAQSVTISDSTSGSTVRYTTDGSNPSATNGTVYSGAFTVSQTTTVKAIAYKSGMTDSDIATSFITIGSSSNVDFGPNVKIFDPSMSSASIQSTVDTIFNQMQSNQFGSERYALLFKPGSYNVNVNVGFYTSVYGLGQMPDDVNITGAVRCEADWMNGNATCNFWRSVENLAVSPTYVSNNLTTAGTLTWAVSQAAPMRRVHIKGGLSLWDPYGTNYDGAWSSGGFISDSKVDGTISSGSQQQFLTRNSQMGSWNGGNWNMVFVGNNGAPTNDSSFPSVPNTVVGQTPVVREKPFLTIDSNGKYSVFVPALRSNSQGISWANGMGQGTSMSIDQFYIARSDRDTAASINAALNQGKNLIFTPGVYHLSDSIKVNNPNTVILGLGLATLVPDNGTAAMTVADVDGVNISGLLFDAGSNNSPTLLEVGPSGSTQNHAANPTSLSDLFFRVGGAAVGKADVSLKINSNNVIGDNFWVWRADHGVDGVGWTINTTKNGVVVNGNDVTIYGLFVEHFHEYQTLWNGNGGRVYFYQSEMPYDVPNQASWMSHNGTVNGYASYKVADNVTTHQLYGSGIYSYFRDAVVSANTGIEVPTTSGVKVHHACSVYLTGNGEITHVVNNTGAAAKAGSTRQTVTDY
ncbi:galactose-binding domain-containing protein [Clostridium sp. 'White wine YQ']|uniref:galactose-binding domain-containing protein n=1 Tax=Clostridium sp. 'White wine YQ' TaxID=3027474 RepID=UPI0023660601|nr:discoidin domain-containing protein [Clostridium sp. 'White wine YQ']MDD7793350.1 discoidin domain-containing protein [Clostridium sp. 'White wine YQ']